MARQTNQQNPDNYTGDAIEKVSSGLFAGEHTIKGRHDIPGAIDHQQQTSGSHNQAEYVSRFHIFEWLRVPQAEWAVAPVHFVSGNADAPPLCSGLSTFHFLKAQAPNRVNARGGAGFGLARPARCNGHRNAGGRKGKIAALSPAIWH